MKRVDFQGSREEWDELGSRFSDFTINQSYAWGEGRKGDGWTVSRDLWMDDGDRIVAMATALRRRVRGVRLLYMSRGPVVLGEGVDLETAEARFQATIAAYRRSLRWGELLVCAIYQNPAQITPPTIEGAGLFPLFSATEEYRFSAVVKLEHRDSLVQGASSNWRKLFRKSKDLLDRVKTSDDPEVLLAARALVGRLEESKGFTTTLTPSLIRAVGQTRARLFYLESESGQMSAALLVALCGRRASRFMAGVAPDEARKHRGIGRVLEVAASRWAFDSGVYDYDLEGISPRNPGVSDFKKGMRGKMFAISGTHAASRPAFLARAFSTLKRRRWRQAIDIWRASKRYFLEIYARRLTRKRFAWERLRLYRRNLQEKSAPMQRPGYGLIHVDRFDRSAFEYRLSTVRYLWSRIERLAPETEEFFALTDKDGLAAGYAFVRWDRAPVPEIDGDFPLEGGEVYMMGGYILPKHRGERLFPFLLDEICAHLRRRGVRAVVVAVNPANVPSARAIAKCGFAPYEEVRFRRIGPWRSVRWHPVPPE